MALPPTIPTSFVPKQSVSPLGRRVKTGTNLLLLAAGGIMAVSLLSGLAVFGYKTYLVNARDAKAAQLVKAQQDVDMDTVENFVRLRNRLTSATSIINQHVLLSRFFAVLEERSLKNVQFKTLTIEVKDDRTAKMTASGIATSFNALAAQSAAFADEKRIKSAIFSDIGPDTGGTTIHFSLTADIDPKLIVAGSATPFGTPSETPPGDPAVQTQTQTQVQSTQLPTQAPVNAPASSTPGQATTSIPKTP